MEYVITALDAFSLKQIIVIAVVFICSGFVRTGLGFGGVGLALPFLLLIGGGYMTGTTLLGAPLIAPVYSNNVARKQFRDTLFILWIILVLIKMVAFVAFDVPLNGQFALLVASFVVIGHYLGLKAHGILISSAEKTFKHVLGLGLAAVSLVGLINAV